MLLGYDRLRAPYSISKGSFGAERFPEAYETIVGERIINYQDGSS